jgi:hypothetical protein
MLSNDIHKLLVMVLPSSHPGDGRQVSWEDAEANQDAARGHGDNTAHDVAEDHDDAIKDQGGEVWWGTSHFRM